MTRLIGTGGDLDDEHLTEPEIRRLAAGVPRGGQQRHPGLGGESIDPERHVDDEPRTLPADWPDRPGRVGREPLPPRDL